MSQPYPIVFLVDVDDTLLEEDLWGKRVTTVFPRQGEFAVDPVALASYPPADITVERISDLLSFNLSDLIPARSLAVSEVRSSTPQPMLNFKK